MRSQVSQTRHPPLHNWVPVHEHYKQDQRQRVGLAECNLHWERAHFHAKNADTARGRLETRKFRIWLACWRSELADGGMMHTFSFLSIFVLLPYVSAPFFLFFFLVNNELVHFRHLLVLSPTTQLFFFLGCPPVKVPVCPMAYPTLDTAPGLVEQGPNSP